MHVSNQPIMWQQGNTQNQVDAGQIIVYIEYHRMGINVISMFLTVALMLVPNGLCISEIVDL